MRALAVGETSSKGSRRIKPQVAGEGTTTDSQRPALKPSPTTGGFFSLQPAA